VCVHACACACECFCVGTRWVGVERVGEWRVWSECGVSDECGVSGAVTVGPRFLLWGKRFQLPKSCPKSIFCQIRYYATVCWSGTMLPYANVCWRILTYADVCGMLSQVDLLSDQVLHAMYTHISRALYTRISRSCRKLIYALYTHIYTYIYIY
jgi:hypothetical protein